MAEIKSFPNNKDEYIGAEYPMKWLHGRTSGVFGADNNLAVTAVQNSMEIDISDGVGWMSNNKNDGVVVWNDNEEINGSKLRLSVDAADGALERIDRVVVSWETTNYVARPTISVLKGVASGSPVAPELTNSSTMRQISLARINIPAGSLSITSSMITDERLDESVCGIVTESIKIDTSMVNAQFAEMLATIKANLNEIVSGQIATGAVTTEKINVDADLSINSHRLTNVADPVDASDALNKAHYENTRSKTVKLWENASPNSAFAAQTIALDLSEYDAVSGYLRLGQNTDVETYFEVRIGHTARVHVTSNTSTNTHMRMYTREISASITGITISKAINHAFDEDTYTEVEHVAIPTVFYGIKGVIKE